MDNAGQKGPYGLVSCANCAPCYHRRCACFNGTTARRYFAFRAARGFIGLQCGTHLAIAFSSIMVHVFNIRRVLSAIRDQWNYDWTVMRYKAPCTHAAKYISIELFLFYLFFPTIQSDNLIFHPIHDEHVNTTCFNTSKIVKSEYQDSVAALLHLALTSYTNPPGYQNSRAMWTVKKSYKLCINDKRKHSDVEKLISLMRVELQNMTNGADIAKTLATFWTQLNVESIFKLSVQPNFYSIKKGSPLIYVEPHAAFVKDAMAMLSSPKKRSKLKNVLNLAKKVRRIVDQQVTVLDWEVFSSDEESPFMFDFTTFFKTVLQSRANLNMNKLQFVVTSPMYADNVYMLIRLMPLPLLRQLLIKQLSRSFEADIKNCANSIDHYVPHVASILYMSMLNIDIVDVARKEFHDIYSWLIVAIGRQTSNNLPIDRAQGSTDALKELHLYTDPHLLGISELDSFYAELRYDNSKSWLKQLLILRQFNVALKLQSLSSKARDFVNRWTPATSTKIKYTRIGDSLTVPVAAMLRLKQDDKIKFFLDLAAEMARTFEMEYNYWNSGSKNSYSLMIKQLIAMYQATLSLSYSGWQERCFEAHFLAKDDYTLFLAAETTVKAMVHLDQSPNKTDEYVAQVYTSIIADGSSISRLRVATAFALQHELPTCNTKQVLDCFNPVSQVRLFKWIRNALNEVF